MTISYESFHLFLFLKIISNQSMYLFDTVSRLYIKKDTISGIRNINIRMKPI
ncbi:hypothetical protein LEP1GSC202_3841 [Leptospira yanagawae serovar Saopaulo str. Sao Paulo = ATCC 700523]|uniref:Uncharacterized protein n=1 Tax=Leptospira yanagawae serovar Saopaulo str. Sao Paulo = ATCC 700523 TaxID=1249483 RepID=A0A5E8HHX9_9LEPT|nr:hypothetical protein LEP1GSC202_3841 [Leptospira yanagawae serovar Saopaulo str. Sao Paulo = ATCC 700523]